MNRKVGKYEIVERLGRGGMAEVYRAYHATLDRYVAIKVLHTFLADAPEFRSRFEREARNIARLKHPNIVQVYDFDFEDSNDSYYMVMELIDGPTLKDKLYELSKEGKLFSLEETIRLIREAAGALAYAHKEGMIHRDVKPANLMLEKGERLVLTDFGIAKMVTSPTLTSTGGMVGTPAYMSPEQGMGDLGDERSDLYALGVIMYEMLAGHVPYLAETPLALILKHVNEIIPSACEVRPDLPLMVDDIINRLMAKIPQERYQKAEDVIVDLNKLEQNLKKPIERRVVAQPATPRPEALKSTLRPVDPTRLLTEALKDTAPAKKTMPTRQPEKRPNRLMLGCMSLVFGGIILVAGYMIGANFGVFPKIVVAIESTPSAIPVIPVTEVTAELTAEATLTASPSNTPSPTDTLEPTETDTPTLPATVEPSHTPTLAPTIALTSTVFIEPSVTSAPSLTPNQTQTLAVEQTATTAACVFDYAIIEQSPEDGEDGGFFTVNSSYSREITLFNSGTCSWGPNTSLVFLDGESFQAGPRVFIRQQVDPGSETTLLFDAVLPSKGDIKPISGRWQLRTPGQIPIGEPLVISIMVYDPGS